MGKNVAISTGLFRGHPTQFAAFLGTGFGFAFAIFISAKKKLMKIGSVLAILSCLLGIISSSKRAGLIAIVVIILFYLFFEKQNISKKSIIIFAVIVLGIWSIFTFGDYIIVRIGGTEEQLRGADNTASRYAIWSAHLIFFVNHPEIWPIGVWWEESINVNQYVLASHNTFLRYLIYAGIPFFFFFYRNIFRLFKHYFKNKQTMHFNYLYPLIGYLVPSAMNDNYDTNYLPLILALGLVYSIDTQLKSQILKSWIKGNYEENKVLEDSNNKIKSIQEK